MISISNRDLVGGLLLLLTGLMISVYVYLNYDLGTFRRMGTGMFPFGVGVLLTAIGAIISLNGIRTYSRAFEVSLRPPIFILASVSIFALTIDRLGAIVAIVLTAFVCAFAESKPRLKATATLGIGLTLFVWLTFVVGLGSPIKMTGW